MNKKTFFSIFSFSLLLNGGALIADTADQEQQQNLEQQRLEEQRQQQNLQDQRLQDQRLQQQRLNNQRAQQQYNLKRNQDEQWDREHGR